MKLCAYAIYNRLTDKIYIGYTNNINRRLSEHNRRLGNHFTSKIEGKWELVYKEVLENRKKAIRREKQLKSYRGRQFIKKLILD